MDEQTNTDVIDSSSPAVEAPNPGAASAPAGDQGESAPVEQPSAEAAAPFQVPENDDDLKGQENNPHVQAVIQLRQELRARDQRLDTYKPLDQWKDIATSIGDPALAQSAHELVNAIHTPVSAAERSQFPSGFTTRPFLDRIDSESPGTASQFFRDLVRYPDVDPQGRPSTVNREWLRDQGIDPDRMQEYRDIDKLRASSGVVTAADLAKIPEPYHEAFKSMSQAAQEDILDQMEDSPALAEEHLRIAQRALASERFEQEQKDREAQAKEEKERQLHERIQTTVQEDITAEVRSLSDSIHQSLSALTFSSDPTINDLEKSKILSTIATLQNPAYRFVAENALKAVGASLDGFDELANRWLERRSAYKTFEAMGDKWQANRALSEATLAHQQLLVRLNDYAMRLAKAGGDRAAAAAGQVETALSAASGRFVPNGNGNSQQGFQNPYEQNPHPFGSPEYYKFIKDVDKEYKVTNGSMFG